MPDGLTPLPYPRFERRPDPAAGLARYSEEWRRAQLGYAAERLGRPLESREVAEMNRAFDQEQRRCRVCDGRLWVADGDSFKACPGCNTEDPMARRMAAASLDRPPVWLSSFNPALQPTSVAQRQCERGIAAVRAWVAKAERPFLTLQGASGCGKSHLAMAATTELCQRGVPVFFTDGGMFVDQARASASEEPSARTDAVRYLRRAAAIDRLVIDDLGAKVVKSDWVTGEYHAVLDQRFRRGAPTMVTTNLPDALLARAVGDRIVSRLGDVIEAERVLMHECEDMRKRRR